LRQLQDSGSVDSSLRHLRELLSRPQALFDPHATVAALEHLVDVSREKACNDASRYAIILRQTRSLLASPSLQPLLLKLLGAQEEVAISKEIQKALKSCAPPWIPRLQDARSQAAPYWRGQQRGGPTCYNCGRKGHIARNCSRNKQERN